MNGAGCAARVGFGALFALRPPTFAGLFAFAGLCCAFGGVPTIEGGDFGDSGELAGGWLGCSGVVSCGVVAGGVLEPDGVVSCGVVPVGVVSVGVVSVGVVSVGVVSVGVVSVGVVSVGVVSVGVVSVGVVSFLQWSSF